MDVVSAVHRTPATLLICALAIALSINGWSSVGLDPFVLDGRAFRDEPWRLLSAHFVHANFIHLFFNLSWIWYLGREIEERLGGPLFLGAIFFLLLGGSAAEVAFDRGAIGLSGVVYGLWALLFVGQRRCEQLRGVLTARTNQLMIVWFFFCILATVTGMLPISNWGHGAGAVLGALVGLSLRADAGLRWIAAPIAFALLALLTAGATVWRPAWNFGGGAIDYELEGQAALERFDWTAAEHEFRNSLRCDARNERAWWNLGCALAKQDRHEESVEALYRAFACGPIDVDRKEVLLRQLLWLVESKIQQADDEAAFQSAQRAVEVAPNDEESWQELANLANTLKDEAWSKRAKAELARLVEKR